MNTEIRADAEATPVTRRHVPRRAAWWLGGFALLLVTIPVGVVLWAGSEGSLSRALQLAQRFLPEGQALEFNDAQGSVAGGGRIGRLQWSATGTEVEIEDLQLSWSLRELLQRDLRVRTLSIRRLHVRTTPQPQPEQPFTMPDELTLPFRVTLPLEIARIELARLDDTGTATTHVIEGLAARYRYDGEQHALRLTSLRYGKSLLQADARLHARTLALTARMDASLRDLVTDVPMAMQATLTATGTLAGGDAANVDLTFAARQQAPPAEAARVEARALIHPWRTQPAQQVDVELSQFNAHAFLSQAPVTSVQGRATVQPIDASANLWTAVVDLSNDQAGAWDRQRLPLRRLEAKARLSLDDVRIDSARAELGGRTPAGSVELRGEIPLNPAPQPALQADLRQVDLRGLLSSLPRTSLTGPVTLEPWQDGRRIEADIRNASPGPLDSERAPLRQLLADLRMGPEQWHIETFDAVVGAGRAQVRGNYIPQSGRMDLRADLQKLPLRDLHAKFAGDIGALLSGTASVAGSMNERLDFDASLSSEAAGRTTASARSPWDLESFEASGSWAPTRLMVKRIHAIAFQSTVEGRDIDVSLPRMQRVRGQLTAVTPGMQLRAETSSGRQTEGGKVVLQLDSAEQVLRWVRGLPFMEDRVPILQARGAATLDAQWQGGWRQWLEGLKDPARHPQLRLNATARTEGLHVELPATAGQRPLDIDVRKLTLDVQGNLRAATIAVDGDASARDTHALLELRLRTAQQGGRSGAPRWNIALEKFAGAVTLPDDDEPWTLQVSENLQVIAQTGTDLELRASAGDATLLPPTRLAADQPLKVTWQPLVWRRSARGGTTLQSTGSLTGLQPAWLDGLRTSTGEGTLAANGLSTDLVLRGEWNVQMTDHVAISARLQRESGDLTLADSLQPVGVRTLDLAVQAADANVKADLNWDTERAGSLTASLATRLTRQAEGWTLPPESPLQGSVRAKLERLNAWSFLVPPGWRIDGSLDATATVAGTVQQPQLTGGIEADGLNVRSVLDGVDLHDGKLRATLRGSGMDIAELTFEGGTGSRAYVRGFSGNRTPPPRERGRMTARGSIDWGRDTAAGEAETGISMNLAADLQRMQVLVRNDRQMTLSGNLSAGLDAGQLRLRGDLKVDRAAIQLPEAGAPTLGDDVKIVRSADLRNAGAVEARQIRAELETRKPLDMEIKVNLGSDLALEGEGITTRLEGELTVRSAVVGNAPFSVFGEVRSVEGRYRAWGQELNVESGVVRFNGPYENPSLDLLAIRPNIEVRAGVRVTGTLMAPRVLLYSDPELPEGEKLSWVVLGRATVIAGGEGTSLQQAALGLAAGQLTGRLATGLGVDELGFSDSGVSIGKRISNELYLTYQQGLAGAASTLFIFYDITRKLTIRGQASEASAVDLVYSFEFD